MSSYADLYSDDFVSLIKHGWEKTRLQSATCVAVPVRPDVGCASAVKLSEELARSFIRRGRKTSRWAPLPVPMASAVLQDEWTSPYMPRQAHAYPHSPHIREHFPYNAAASRPVNKAEISKEPKAQQSMKTEFEKLLKAGTFDFSDVHEAGKLMSAARDGRRKKIHIGLVFGICVEKVIQLPECDPNRKFKGRYVFQGNNVKDEFNQCAVFQELSSSPASMESAKCVDAYSCFPGHIGQQSDAEQAYIQAQVAVSYTHLTLPTKA